MKKFKILGGRPIRARIKFFDIQEEFLTRAREDKIAAHVLGMIELREYGLKVHLFKSRGEWFAAVLPRSKGPLSKDSYKARAKAVKSRRAQIRLVKKGGKHEVDAMD
ncbi:MAG: hypothetical protein ACREQW_04965 [Candidatus Binatia bacterium]